MNYIWQVALRARVQGIPFEDVVLVPSKGASPYTEISFSDINRADLDDEPVEVNLLYRFWEMFSGFIDPNYTEYEELRGALVDLILHYITKLDLRQGLTRNEYYARFLREDVASGRFGRTLKENLGYFEEWQLPYVFHSMLKLYLTGPSLLAIKSLFSSIYPKSIVYFSADAKKELLMYLGREKTGPLARQLSFLCDLFVPVDYTVHLFWKTHFGILDVHQTMHPDDIMLF